MCPHVTYDMMDYSQWVKASFCFYLLCHMITFTLTQDLGILIDQNWTFGRTNCIKITLYLADPDLNLRVSSRGCCNVNVKRRVFLAVPEQTCFKAQNVKQGIFVKWPATV